MSAISSGVVEVPILVIQVEAPNVLQVRKTPISANDRDFLRSVEDYCGRIFTSSSSLWRSSLNERHLNVGEKYFALDSRMGVSQWRRGILSNVVTVRGGHRACIYLMDEARSIDVPLNHLLPMPDTFGNRPPLLRKVIISGIRPCSLVTDPLTCQTNYGPSVNWDTAAEQYCKKLFLFNPGLSDVRLHHVRLLSESESCLADLSLRVNDLNISSYALHLKQMRFATIDEDESFALATIRPTDRGRVFNSSGLVPPFRSLSSLMLVDEMGSTLKCHEVDSATNSTDVDRNNNVELPMFGSKQHALMEEESLERSNTIQPCTSRGTNSLVTVEPSDRMRITFITDSNASHRSVSL